MNKITNLVAFMLGVGVGSVATWHFVKGYYSQLADEEITSVKQLYTVKKDETREKSPKEVADRARQKPDITDYAHLIEEGGYSHTDYTKSAEEQVAEEKKDKPYVISPDEFGEKEGYETISLTYYADGVLADEDDDPIRDIEELIGDALDHLGELEDDSVFVRDDELGCDYEILRDNRKFESISRPGASPKN